MTMNQVATSEVASAGIEQVAGEGQETTAAAAPAATVAVVTAFAAEDDELARLETLEKEEREATEKANAEAAATAAAEAAAATGAKPDATGQQPANGNVGTPQGAGKTRDPKDAAIIALNHRSRQLTNQVATLEGEVRVLRELAADKGIKPANTVEEVQRPPTAEEQIASIDEQIIELAQKYDDGKISTAEWKTQELALLDQRSNLREPQAAVAANDTVMEQHAETLANDYPILNILTVDQLQPFYGQAMAQAEAEGKPITSTNSGTMELRERMAKLATNHYMPLLTKQAAGQPKAGSSGAQGKPAAAATPSLSAQAVAREAKLELAGNHPPNISTLGAGALGGEKSEAEIMADLQAFGGDDVATDAYLKANAGLISKVMRGVLG